MRHTSQKSLAANKLKALLVNGNVKEAIEYAKKRNIDSVEFGKIASTI